MKYLYLVENVNSFQIYSYSYIFRRRYKLTRYKNQIIIILPSCRIHRPLRSAVCPNRWTETRWRFRSGGVGGGGSSVQPIIVGWCYVSRTTLSLTCITDLHHWPASLTCITGDVWKENNKISLLCFYIISWIHFIVFEWKTSALFALTLYMQYYRLLL